MKKLNTVTVIIFLFIINTTLLFSQETASANWLLTDPAGGGTGYKASIEGLLSAEDQLLEGLIISSYSGPNKSQRIILNGLIGSWPANISQKIDTAFIQFSVSPNSGLTFFISNLSLKLAASGSTTMKAEVYFSTEPDFSKPQLIEYSTGKNNNYLASGVFTQVVSTPNILVTDDKTFYLRVYPWNEDANVSYSKYVCVQEVIVSGMTFSSSLNQIILSTNVVSEITDNSAVAGGNIIFDGGSPITERGVCWNITGNPTIADNKTINGTGIGVYESKLTGLSPLTNYFVRAYATNSEGTSYGNEITFTTTPIPVLAFPGAEGYGRFTTGGRGGKVYEVTRLEDDNEPGSLRYAIRQNEPRTIVFRVSGNIELKSNLSISSGNVTIAGQTAPGDGICLKNYTFTINADNVILRYLRIRHGDEVTNKAGDEYDASSGTNRKDIIIDHCTFSWGNDETASFYDNTNFTMQWCMISESFYKSTHSKGNHGYGGIWGGMGATFHHNLFAHHTSRNPRFNGSRYSGQSEKEIVDFVNNVIFNWGGNSVYGGEEGKQNVRANYYKAGPATSSSVKNRILNPSADPGTNTTYGKFYVADNYVEGYPNTTSDNWTTGVQGIPESIKQQVKSDSPFPIAEINTQTAEQAYLSVLENVGASFPKRDAVDERIINEARTGTAQFGITYGGGGKGIIDSQRDVGGYPVLNSIAPPTDTDHDGMPDYYETEKGLNPNDPSDGNLYSTSGYTNLEDYLNGLIDGSVTSINNENDIPEDFRLDHNYPNPFNPSTIIGYSLPYSGFVSLKVFDVLGKEIASLVNEFQNAGNYKVTFNGQLTTGNLQLSSGVYFYTLRTNEKNLTKKMLFLK